MGRQRKHKDEVAFLQSLIKTIATGGALSLTTSLLQRLEDRILALQTGLGPQALTEEGRTSPEFSRSTRDTSHDDASSLDVTHGTNHAQLKLPALGDADSSRSIITIEDIAWGRQSKTLHAENRNEISLPPFSSLLQLTSVHDQNLPTVTQARILITFHSERLAWFHNALHCPTFLQQCEVYWSSGRCGEPLWLALYLSVLSVSEFTLQAVWGPDFC